MAVKTIKLDKNNNYLLNPETGEVVDQYNPNTKLSFNALIDSKPAAVSKVSVSMPPSVLTINNYRHTTFFAFQQSDKP